MSSVTTTHNQQREICPCFEIVEKRFKECDRPVCLRAIILVTTPIATHLVLYCTDSLQILLRRLRFSEVSIRGLHPDEHNSEALTACAGLLAIAKGSDFTEFMRERYVPGTWSKMAAYEHIPRYTLARTFGCP